MKHECLAVIYANSPVDKRSGTGDEPEVPWLKMRMQKWKFIEVSKSELTTCLWVSFQNLNWFTISENEVQFCTSIASRNAC